MPSRFPRTTPTKSIRREGWNEGEACEVKTYLSGFDRERIASAGAATCCLRPSPTDAALEATSSAEMCRYNTVGPLRPEGATIDHFRAVEERQWQLQRLNERANAGDTGQ